MSPAPEEDYSFPSGHAMGTMAVMSALVILTCRRVGAGSSSSCWTIRSGGWSVSVYPVHFPSDIMAGWSVAGLGDGVYQTLSSHFYNPG